MDIVSATWTFSVEFSAVTGLTGSLAAVVSIPIMSPTVFIFMCLISHLMLPETIERFGVLEGSGCQISVEEVETTASAKTNVLQKPAVTEVLVDN